MSATSLKLPHGYVDGRKVAGAFVAWFWGPLRIVVDYRINLDAYIARFDSVLDDDEQWNCAFEGHIPDGGPMDARDFGWLCLPFAMKAFREGRVTKGHQLATPTRITFDSL